MSGRDMSPPGKPVTILIAALGGEGGGVLTGWIVSAAEALGLPVQSTSIPGVAQRTGATTYYIEIVPAPWRELGDRRPVLSLAPGIGDIDILLASELMEAGRAVAAGFVTPGQTLTIASTSRFYVMDEKIAMGDGRYDAARLMKAIQQQSKEHILFDMEEIARRTGAIVNAVMLGAIAGCGRLPIPAEALEAAIRADRKAVETNLRGFRAGLEAARQANAARPSASDKRGRGGAAALAELEREIASVTSAAAQDIITEGARRLVAYQHIEYAQLYIDRLGPIHLADDRVGAGGKLVRETARHLAVRMSYEDVIRVAQAKIDPARLARIAAEMGATADEPLAITEFLKPGIEELASILPPRLARFVLRHAEGGRLGRWHWGMEVNTVSVTGFLRFWLLARLRRWRPHTYRFQEEQRAIEAWLALIVEAARSSGDLALEVAECARLIKGYGDTYKRGCANYREIETHVIRPALAGHIPIRRAVDAVVSARTAALVDPDGESLARCLADVATPAAPRQAAE
jgi:indolepyruvate ferredoxin oxidoreductase beta subunit